ncbi:MAG TPA: hypothetical protein PLH46_00945 [Caldisericia bacterium]|nr:hypothetical protein [Caldisericia bacterium]
MFKEILEKLKRKEISEIKTDSGDEFSKVEVSDVKEKCVEVKDEDFKFFIISSSIDYLDLYCVEYKKES